MTLCTSIICFISTFYLHVFGSLPAVCFTFCFPTAAHFYLLHRLLLLSSVRCRFGSPGVPLRSTRWYRTCFRIINLSCARAVISFCALCFFNASRAFFTSAVCHCATLCLHLVRSFYALISFAVAFSVFAILYFLFTAFRTRGTYIFKF